MSSVRQCLEDSLQLQIQRVSAGWTGEQPCTAGMSRSVGRLPVPMTGNDFERHEFFIIIIISYFLEMFCHYIFSCGAGVSRHARPLSSARTEGSTTQSGQRKWEETSDPLLSGPSSWAPSRHGRFCVAVQIFPSQVKGPGDHFQKPFRNGSGLMKTFVLSYWRRHSPNNNFITSVK